jgi:hypothetical protein
MSADQHPNLQLEHSRFALSRSKGTPFGLQWDSVYTSLHHPETHVVQSVQSFFDASKLPVRKTSSGPKDLGPTKASKSLPRTNHV